jgi:hypothetical protein
MIQTFNIRITETEMGVHQAGGQEERYVFQSVVNVRKLLQRI